MAKKMRKEKDDKDRKNKTKKTVIQQKKTNNRFINKTEGN